MVGKIKKLFLCFFLLIGVHENWANWGSCEFGESGYIYSNDKTVCWTQNFQNDVLSTGGCDAGYIFLGGSAECVDVGSEGLNSSFVLNNPGLFACPTGVSGSTSQPFLCMSSTSKYAVGVNPTNSICCKGIPTCPSGDYCGEGCGSSCGSSETQECLSKNGFPPVPLMKLYMGISTSPAAGGEVTGVGVGGSILAIIDALLGGDAA